MQLEELLSDVEVRSLRGDPRVEINALTYDSRQVTAGACFACVPGEHTDGHAHAPEAVSSGAVALLVERPLDLGVTEAEVASVRGALGPAAARFYGAPSTSMRCLGVTGTNGKTTVTYLLENVLRAAGERAGVIGTTGARIDGASLPLEHTTPEATDLQALLARMRDEGVRGVAMEVSSHALDQHRVDGTKFAAVGFTNLTHDHLDYHGSLDAYFGAKARLFDHEHTAAAAINVDDQHGRKLAAMTAARGLPVITFSVSSFDADLVAGDIKSEASGSRFMLSDQRTSDTAEVRIALLGEFNVSNAAAAAAIALASDLPFERVIAGLGSKVTVPGRFERVDAGQPFTVLVDYAHTPDALSTVLRAARAFAGANRVMVVFGCGGDRDREKRPLMGAAAASLSDVAVVTSDNPRGERPEDIADAVVAGMGTGSAEHFVELDRRAAIGFALRSAATGDVVVIAGKGHETGQTIGEVTTPFDDRAVAREELGALAWS